MKAYGAVPKISRGSVINRCNKPFPSKKATRMRIPAGGSPFFNPILQSAIRRVLENTRPILF